MERLVNKMDILGGVLLNNIRKYDIFSNTFAPEGKAKIWD